MRKLVSVFMDVEDPINPQADDAALQVAHLFTEAGVRGSFCLTGEKCRTLLARGRTDVLEAFAPHCLGLHTDTHSFHPTTMELLAEVRFEEGCELAYAAERRGFEAFYAAFRRPPVFWGGGGNTWSPEITDALKRLEITANVYALTAMPDEAIHRFNQIVMMPQALSIGEPDWHDDARAAKRGEQVLDRIAAIPQPWVGVFVGHPTRLRHTDYWDVPYYAGRTPPEPEYAEPVSNETWNRGKANLGAFIHRLKSHESVVGVDEALGQPWRYRRPTATEQAFFEDRSARNIRGAVGWPLHRPGLSAEKIVEKTLALAETVEIAEL